MRTPGMRERRGAMLVLIAIMMGVFLIVIAFSMDVAFMQLTRTELRAATDAAARAGAEALSRTQDGAQAIAAAQGIASQNQVAGAPLLLDATDVVLGRSTQAGNGSWTFVPGLAPPNSVRVVGRREAGSRSGPVNLLFGRVLGRQTFEPIHDATATQLDRDVCIVMDRSGSMNRFSTNSNTPPAVVIGGVTYGGTGCNPPHPTDSRWAAATIAVEAFLQELENTEQIEMVGLVSYAHAGFHCGRNYNSADNEQDLTDRYSDVRDAMVRLGSQPIQGWTNIGAGIDEGINNLTSPFARLLAEKTMIVLTDGRWNRGNDPVQAATAAANLGIRVHTITFSSEANQLDMQRVAAATNGNHYHAPDALALARIFREIAATLPVVLTK